MYNQVRIIHANGRVSVLTKSFSQTIEMLKGLSKDQTDGFWNKNETLLPSGDSVYLVREGA